MIPRRTTSTLAALATAAALVGIAAPTAAAEGSADYSETVEFLQSTGSSSQSAHLGAGSLNASLPEILGVLFIGPVILLCGLQTSSGGDCGGLGMIP